MAPLLTWSLPFARGNRGSELSCLRKELQAEHERLVVNLHSGHDQLKVLAQWVDRAGIERLLLAYKALIALVEREDFTTMRSERIPVVIAQVMTRLARLGRMLRETQARTAFDCRMSIH